MKISSISLMQSFKSNSYYKNNSDSKNSDIHYSTVNSNGRWFYDSCSNPSLIIYPEQMQYIDDAAPKMEYYSKIKNEKGEIEEVPEPCAVQLKNGKTCILKKGFFSDFTGIGYQENENGLEREIRYLRSYPVSITEYKEGKEYKYIHYSQNTHKINQIYYYDASFELSQKSNHNNATVELHTLNANGEKMAVQITAAKNSDSTGMCECYIPGDDGYKTISLYWSYPNIKYSFYGKREDARDLQNALFTLKKTLKKDEYKDFACNSYINQQLYYAIGYLYDLKNS